MSATPPPFEPLPDFFDPEGAPPSPSPADPAGSPLAVDSAADIAAEVAAPSGRLRGLRALGLPVLSLVGFGLVGFAVLAATRSDLRESPLALTPEDASESLSGVRPPDPDEPYTFASLDIHPDRLHRAYLGGAFSGSDADSPTAQDFRWRLDMYRRAYGEDDNYTVRAYDDRDGRMLDVLTLEGARGAFALPGGGTDWDAVNLQRRLLSTQIRDKWVAAGVPLANLVVRWGYRDQTQEARDRDGRYVAYEVNLARRLGLSVLATEIGTVETFNQDQLVSSAGARSRYQMMPDILRMFDVEQYALPVAAGGTVEVREEWHPLLAMEPSLMLVRAYANAVGHELPGISAYHTGPGNLFALYREFLRAHPGMQGVRGRHVSDAYMWGVTEGFERVDAVSSFGAQSRVYLLKAYGALRATESRVVDPDGTFRGERVRLRTGQTLLLSEMLATLAPHERRLDWGPADAGSLYLRFREMNPHIALPVAGGEGVPAIGDLRLVSSAGATPVRFFLPLGATDVLRRAGLDAVGESVPFDGRTFLVDDGERTATDRQYDALVEETGRFGFTRANAARLRTLHDRMQSLAAQQPDSRYRQTQAKIIRIHHSVWRTAGFNDLVATTETLFSLNPLVQMGRQPVALAATDSAAPAPARRRDSIAPIPPLPPRVEDTVRY